MAFLYVEHLVEGSGDMETCGIAVWELLAGIKLLECKPFLVGKSVFHLVAIRPDILRPLDRVDLGKAATSEIVTSVSIGSSFLFLATS